MDGDFGDYNAYHKTLTKYPFGKKLSHEHREHWIMNKPKNPSGPTIVEKSGYLETKGFFGGKFIYDNHSKLSDGTKKASQLTIESKTRGTLRFNNWVQTRDGKNYYYEGGVRKPIPP